MTKVNSWVEGFDNEEEEREWIEDYVKRIIDGISDKQYYRNRVNDWEENIKHLFRRSKDKDLGNKVIIEINRQVLPSRHPLP